MSKAIIITAALCAVLLSAAAGSLAAVMSTPCATEDSANCYWDAQSRGNGRGHSFISLRLTDGAEPYIVFTR